MRNAFFQGRTVLLAASLLFVLTACSGSDGSNGANGANGTNGINGTNGTNGTNGVNGINGLNGADGTNGTAGINGTNGTNGIDGINGTNGTNGINGTNGTNGTNGLSAVTSGLKVTVTGVTVSGAVPTVAFSLTDDRGYPVDIAGKYSLNTATPSLRFGLAKVTTDANGDVLPYTVLTGALTSPGTVTAAPTEVGSGAGTYTYSFGTLNTPFDPSSSATYTVWILASRQTDVVNTTNARTYTAVNQPYSWIPSGVGVPVVRQLVTEAACASCHGGFKPESATNVGGFHSYARVAPEGCNVCHNPARTNKTADSAVFIHRIHNGPALQSYTTGNRTVGSQVDVTIVPAGFRTCSVGTPCVCTVANPCTNLFHNISATYPQDTRNCAACHAGAAQGGQISTRQSRVACGSCHDYVAFDASEAATCTNPVTAVGGIPVPCNHAGGAQTDDTMCLACHGTGKGWDVAKKHIPGVTQTNGSFLPAAGVTPTGGATLAFVIGNVLVEANGNPSMNFKLLKNGADVVFNTPTGPTDTVLMTNFVGTSRVYFAFGAPQDGTVAPADFNYSANIDLVNAWNQSLAATTAAFTGPDANGFYKLTAQTVFVPATDTILTGAIGVSATFRQTDVPGYTYTPTGSLGGLAVVVNNVAKTAIGKAGRRTIVDNAKCLDCHAQLGISPTFHGGGRNDGTLCAVCHTANRSSSGWAVNSKDVFHALHAGRVRTTPLNWQSTLKYWEVEFPNRINNCLACHAPGTFDLSAPASAAAMDNMLWSTVASGNLIAVTASTSPYVASVDYGVGYSYNANTLAGAVTSPAATTLVTSPITAACVACHDSNAAFSHMDLNGGAFYAPRSSMPSGILGVRESCMVCHGAGAIADIKAVHGQ